jgi:AAA family ATPase
MMVQNALVEAIDCFHRHCRILAIAQNESHLPSELTKIGRLEKTVHMLPPTQAQRVEIWRNILGKEAAIDAPRWALPLASSTPGCVARDLHRALRNAKTQSLANQRKEEHNETIVLEWEVIRDAVKALIPSQLSELDVVHPEMLDSDSLSWKDIFNHSFNGLGGYHSVKSHLYRHVVAPWRHFLQSTSGQETKLWVDPPAGVLFYGRSGTGKTMAAKCLAASLELPLIQVRTADILDKWLGGSESILRSLFARARAASPCVLFLDEIDSIAVNRQVDDTDELSSRILSTLLNEMDGVSSSIQKSRFLVIACTNRIESLDSALLRPGRLHEHILMDTPTAEDLEDILRLRLVKIPVHPALSLRDLASSLLRRGATGADVEGLCREAFMIAMRSSQTAEALFVSQSNFDLAISEMFGSLGASLSL